MRTLEETKKKKKTTDRYIDRKKGKNKETDGK